MTSMSGKTVLVTGATGGIGLATAKGLAAMGATVLVHGRSEARGHAALAEIRAAVPDAKVEFVQGDLSSLASVRALAADVLRRTPKLDVLINNAGCVHLKRETTKDGFEATFGVNHLAPFLLTTLLLDRIKASAPARIVNLSSGAHHIGKIDFDDLQLEKRYSGFGAYAYSKLANILFTRALHTRLAGTGVTVNAVHPGAVRTGLGQNNKGHLLLRGVAAVMSLFFVTPEKGAKTSLHVATSPALDGVSGEYFANEKIKPIAKAAQDADTAERLWRESEVLVARVV